MADRTRGFGPTGLSSVLPVLPHSYGPPPFKDLVAAPQFNGWSVATTLPEITPQAFRRRTLRAFLIGHEAWLSTRDLRRLFNTGINDRLIGRLCDDPCQRVLPLHGNGRFNGEPLISESGLHTLPWMYGYHPENRLLRRWVSQEVVSGLWNGQIGAGRWGECLLSQDGFRKLYPSYKYKFSAS